MPIPALLGMAAGTLLSSGAQYAMNAGKAKGNSKRPLKQQAAYNQLAENSNIRLAEFNQKLAQENMVSQYALQAKGIEAAGMNRANVS